MRSVIPCSRLLAIGFVLATLPVDPVSGQTFAVTVNLMETAEAADSIVRIGDIAKVESADPSLIASVSKLDIAEFAADRDTQVVCEAEVRLRIVLSGVASRQIAVTGAENVEIHRRARPSLEESITQPLRVHLATVRNVPLEKMRVRLVQPINKLVLDQVNAGRTRVELLSDSLNSLGNLRPKYAIYLDGRLISTFTAAVEVQQQADVPIAQLDLPKNHRLTAQDFEIKQRWFSRDRQIRSVLNLVGQTTRTSIRVGQSITETQLLRRTSRTEAVVKARDRVRVTVHSRNVTVVLTGGEALQRGSIGDIISVRNPRSKQVLRGRVDAAGSVVIRR